MQVPEHCAQASVIGIIFQRFAENRFGLFIFIDAEIKRSELCVIKRRSLRLSAQLFLQMAGQPDMIFFRHFLGEILEPEFRTGSGFSSQMIINIYRFVISAGLDEEFKHLARQRNIRRCIQPGLLKSLQCFFRLSDGQQGKSGLLPAERILRIDFQ
ncbi:MAG: hypothetical protein BWY83_03411 [bacterium ADurb.Bin478]|nr:MAG: hypothetical protein BWY83_03411 [bacterium ADurb.Bin478]